MKAVVQQLSRARDTVRLWGSVVKFSHTVFAMPFALSMAAIVARDREVLVTEVLWILVALVSARTAAMGFNRYVDLPFDAQNPRTKSRELPSGKVTPQSVRELIVMSSVLFLFSSLMLGLHCLILAPAVLGFLLLYSWSKRFTNYSHLILGVALALAPGGVWYALTAQFAVLPVVLMVAVALWVAGFDLLYACQDVEFDRAQRLHSFPARFGVARAVLLSRVLHLAVVLLLVLFGDMAQMGLLYFGGVGLFALALLSQHCVVHAGDLSRVDGVFFTRNGIASVVFFLGVLLDVTMRL